MYRYRDVHKRRNHYRQIDGDMQEIFLKRGGSPVYNAWLPGGVWYTMINAHSTMLQMERVCHAQTRGMLWHTTKGVFFSSPFDFPSRFASYFSHNCK